jgi:zinc transporter
MQGAILESWLFDGKGGGSLLSPEEVLRLLNSEPLTWVHLDANHPDVRQFLEQQCSFMDSITINALLAEETRPRVSEVGEGLLVILRGVNLNENEEPEDMVSLRIWVDSKRIITMRKRRQKAITDIREKLARGEGPKDSGDMLVQVITRLFERMEPVLTELELRTDAIEEQVMGRPEQSERREIMDIRYMAISLRRYIAPQREVLSNIRNSPVTWLDAYHRRLLQESQDRAMRYTESLDAIRERAQIIKDELATTLGNHLNRNLFLLSVVAAIFLPLSTLTGLLGINVGGIPGAEDPHAFWIVAGLLLTVVAIQLAIFKKLKWF